MSNAAPPTSASDLAALLAQPAIELPFTPGEGAADRARLANISPLDKKLGCRSGRDGSIKAFVYAAESKFPSERAKHLATDFTTEAEGTVEAIMMMAVGNDDATAVIREVRATIDTATCSASDVRVIPAR